MIKVRLEHTTNGVQVRLVPMPLAEAPRSTGHCVYCKRAMLSKEPVLCKGHTTDCEQRVWMDSRKLRGQS